MQYGWDAAKSGRNAQERGLPFDIAMALFDSVTFEIDDRRRDYGERRIIAFGEVEGRVMVCVYTWRGTADAPVRWIISLRKANAREIETYRRALAS